MVRSPCKRLKNCLSGIRAAWHFRYVVFFGGEGCLRKVCLGGVHP
nr:DUF3265 domain-containing protein [Vibrio cidicii]